MTPVTPLTAWRSLLAVAVAAVGTTGPGENASVEVPPTGPNRHDHTGAAGVHPPPEAAPTGRPRPTPHAQCSPHTIP